MKNIILVATVLLMSASSLAAGDSGYNFGLSLMKYDISVDGPNVGTGDSNLTIYDLKLGYVFNNSVYLGVILDNKTITSNGGTDKRTGTGATVGYHSNGWILDLSYFFTAERDMNGTMLKDGTGFGLDVGHNWMIGSNFYFGVQGSYKSFTYKKVASAAVDNKEKSELYPMVNLGLMF